MKIKLYNIIDKQSKQSINPHIDKYCRSVKRISTVTDTVIPAECLLGLGVWGGRCEQDR